MCGIFALLNYNKITPQIRSCFEKGSSRGPENSILEQHNNIIMGFHRLAINGLNDQSNQPFNINGIILICNGEIYNFRELAKQNNIEMITDSDCEIIIYMYQLYGIEYTLNCLDGVFAFVLYDTNTNLIHIARDPYGVRPLYYFMNWDNTFGFASEQKCIYNLCKYKCKLFQFIPGQYTTINCCNKLLYFNKNNKYSGFPCNEINYLSNKTNSEQLSKLFSSSNLSKFPSSSNLFNIGNSNTKLRSLNFATTITTSTDEVFESRKSMLSLNSDIVLYLHEAVRKRVEGTTDRPIACLLSGGLDSSLICALVNIYYNNPEHRLETYSIGLDGSEDLKYAKMVAQYLDTDHHEIIISEEDFFNAIPEVIHTIESYDTTTVRASVGNYLIGKYIKEHSLAKVIFNGDGADELMGGYLYFHKAPNEVEFDAECKRLLQDIAYFDVLRSDRSISSNGLEPRTPFLDRKWVEFYLSISKKIRYHHGNEQCEKFLIRNAFNEIQPDLLPKEIIWRTKEAFSDGVSSLTRSWFTIIKENVDRLCREDDELEKVLQQNILIYNKLRLINPPTTMEQSYYRYLYNKSYYGTDHIIPYFWMPKYVDAEDASARTLKVYEEFNHINTNTKNHVNVNITVQSNMNLSLDITSNM